VTSAKGWIFDVQKFSIHDGPGIRTTVFMKGCPMRCAWCHNPEGIDREPVLSFIPSKCIGCGYCLRVCPRGAHRADGDEHVLDRDRCEVCGSCTQECYAGALELIGREVTVEEVLADVLSDRPFYENSGGGMTLSGGEPLYQIDFIDALLAAAKAEDLHCCIETCGFADFACFERIMGRVDLFLYDVKDVDPARHLELTGVSNGPILANLRRLHEAGKDVLVRVPLVPGCNDFDDNLAGLAELAASLPNLLGVELMPYHRLGTSKRERIGTAPEARPTEPPADELVARWIATLAEAGVTVVNQRNSPPTG